MDETQGERGKSTMPKGQRSAVSSIGPMVTREVDLPRSGVRYPVLMPSAIDPLLDLIIDDPEQNLPYWAELWPSGVALADAIELSPESVRGQRVIELGCGLGVTAAAALRAGASLTVTDYAAEALTLCRYNSHRIASAEPAIVKLNWRKPDIDSGIALERGYSVVLAADVLYERRDIEPLLGLVQRVLARDGMFWLAEPGRPVAAEFLRRADALGWSRRSEEHSGPWPDPADDGVVVGLHEIRISG